MTIRNAILRAFFWVILGTVLTMGVLSFVEVRRALQSEIAGSLQAGASAALQRIDTFLFAQLENMRVWRRLEVMQDIRVGDVDKRLSQFLSDLKAGQGGSYAALFCTDQHGRIVASSDPTLIGARPPRIEEWIRMPGEGAATVELQPVHSRGDGTVALRTQVPDAFGSSRLGTLYALLDWRAVLDLLDDAAGGPRGAVLVDSAGHVLGASRGLGARADVSGVDLRSWLSGQSEPTAEVRDGRALGQSSLLVGGAVSSGYQHFPGLGWRLFMVEPTQQAYRPIWRMLGSMATLLLLTLAVAVWTSARLADRIARPILDLTERIRRFRQGEAAPPDAAATRIAEVRELDTAYVEMIEALERSREQIVRAGKLAVVGEMAAIMSHEVRTPLGILRSSAQLLERQPDLGERERELVGFIVSETARLNRLVTLLLECARPRPPDFRRQDLHEIAESVLGLLAAKADKKGVSLIQALEAEDAMIDCDREQLTQVLLNLLMNALHFVPERGRIQIATALEGQTLLVRVDDDGPGIPPELRPRIFDPFFSRREGGVGLGLTVVQQMVQVHRGDIEIGESPWGGAGFRLRLPRKHAPEEQEER